MNEVDFLLTNKFNSLSQSEKKRVKELGPHNSKNIKITQATKKCTRNFNPDLFDSVEWLTVRESKQSLRCFYCLLFDRDDNKWSRIGFKDLSHINQSIKNTNLLKCILTAPSNIKHLV